MNNWCQWCCIKQNISSWTSLNTFVRLGNNVELERSTIEEKAGTVRKNLRKSPVCSHITFSTVQTIQFWPIRHWNMKCLYWLSYTNAEWLSSKNTSVKIILQNRFYMMHLQFTKIISEVTLEYTHIDLFIPSYLV